MNLAKEIDALYNLVARDETEDGLNRLLHICKQWDLSIKNEVILLSNRFYGIKKKLNPGEEMDDEVAHQFNLSFLAYLDKIKLDQMLGMKSINQLIEDLTESRAHAIELEQKLWRAEKEIKRLSKLK